MATKTVRPWATGGLCILMLLVFLLEKQAIQWGLAGTLFEDFSFQWSAFTAEPWTRLPTLITCTLLHAGWDHLIFNTLFFLIFAPGVEEALGHAGFVIHFFIWGSVSALLHGFFWPFGAGLIGASGAISGAAGAFFVLYPLRVPQRLFVFNPRNILAQIPSFFWIGLWFLGELKGSFLQLMPEPFSGQVSLVAKGAHVGGFVCGALSALPTIFKKSKINSPL